MKEVTPRDIMRWHIYPSSPSDGCPLIPENESAFIDAPFLPCGSHKRIIKLNLWTKA